MPKLFVNKLVIQGVERQYKVNFINGMNIISGPMYTGKTTVLEFVDYCLGAKSHPRHLEIQKKLIQFFWSYLLTMNRM